MNRQKASRVTASGRCLTCGETGIPRTACKRCVRTAHGAAVTRLNALLRVGTAPAVERMRDAEEARAAWVGADLLLEQRGRFLHVGFEVPPVPDPR